MLASEVILSARDRHRAFDRNNCPDAVALRFLSGYVAELHGKITRLDETALVSEQVVNMPMADFDEGITLLANRRVVGVTPQLTNDDVGVIDLIPWEHRNDRNQPSAAAWMYNGKLFLRSPSTLWNNVATVTVSYIPLPVTLTTMGATVPLPDMSVTACVEKTAAFMARRGTTDASLPPINLKEFVYAANEAESLYLDEVKDRITGVMFRTRDVWPSGRS